MDADIVKKIHAIQRDESLSTAEKAIKRQELLSAKWQAPSCPSSSSPGANHAANLHCIGAICSPLPPTPPHPLVAIAVEYVDPVAGGAAAANSAAVIDGRQSMAEDGEPSTALDDTLKCAFCFDLCVRPVTVRPALN